MSSAPSVPCSRRPLAVAGVLVAVVVTVVVVGSAVLLRPGGRVADSGPAAPRSLVADQPAVVAAALLRDWDRRRAAAWAAGDVGALGRLYAAGSSAGRDDRRLLRAWSQRGLRVEGLVTQVLDLRVVDHRPGRWEVEVVDRVGSATVVAPTGVRRPLPRDAPRTTSLVLVRGPGGAWVVADAGPGSGGGASAARSAAPR